MSSADQIADALGALGFSGPVPWEAVRAAYREALMEVHPDATGAEDSTGRTSTVVESFRLLRNVTDDGRVPLASLVAPTSSTADGLPALILRSSTSDLLADIHAALSIAGTVSGVDRSAGLIQAIIEVDGFAPSQLTAEVLPIGGGDVQVLFTLDPLGHGTAPPLETVVARLSTQMASDVEAVGSAARAHPEDQRPR